MTEFDRMIQLLDTAWLLRSEIVPCLVGPPGIGKTAAVKQHAEAHGCGKVVKIVASRCVPSETVGMTMPNHVNRSMEIYNSMQLSSLEDGDILFLDELLEADQFVLSTLLTVIESREMADGTPLPDIQIIAATNDTIPPEQLKPNIRQRFMFQRFSIDEDQTAEYIFSRTGIRVPSDVLHRMSERGSDYNFLTPRSLTKLCLWIDAADGEQVQDVATTINNIYKSAIGTKLMAARKSRDEHAESPESQFRKALWDIVPDLASANNNFEDCTLTEIYEILQKLPDWDHVQQLLANIEVHEKSEEDISDVDF